ncbi:unnamed protein product [Pseudo-nitzschia multistriata]|uniref:Uncharacterized protein n=1 Tax=Pseudo-nitzschia multistriata TaxID=183589 RepID=A0A448Z8G5_9STRA|nr:unnamed protein product [Pseudo-nitzschia multistriata]
MIQRKLLLPFCLLSSLTSVAAFFQIGPPLILQTRSTTTTTTCNNGESVSLGMATKRKKKKPSMKEKLQRRREKAKGGPNPYADMESPKFEKFNKEDEKEEPIKVANPEAAAEKAKELLKAQRDSVNMLTMVKECIMDRLSQSEFQATLQENGFAVVEDFLGSGSDNNDDKTASPASILSQLQEEGSQMLEKGGMEVDMANLGKGLYIAPVAGGEEQYTTCPRMVEIVVSTTKHVPEVFGDESNEAAKPLKLDASACMATLRTFDRKALKASTALLTGSENVDDVLDKVIPFSIVADQVDDQRKLSLYYYIVPDNWDKACGGGLEFESGEKFYAKNDRLIVFYSDVTKQKDIAWRGSDDAPEKMIGNVLELHLVRPRV